MRDIISDVEQACSCTHNTRSALSAACAIAAAYSAALEGFDKKDLLEVAIEAASLGNQLGEDDLCPDVARRLQWVSKNIEKEKKGLRGWLNPGFRAWEGATFALALVMLYDSYVGTRTTDTQAGDYLVSGPGWKGQVPGGVTQISSPNHAVLVAGRVLVKNDSDLAAAYGLSKQIQLTPLSGW